MKTAIDSYCFHRRGAYLQSWLTDSNFPLTWHLHKEKAGSGAQAGINSHCVDLAQFLVGEIASVVAMKTTATNTLPTDGRPDTSSDSNTNSTTALSISWTPSTRA